jgi:hypothetical protein
MKLKPHDILKHLGFDIEEDGVDINPNDALFVTSALKLAGKTINLENIKTDDLESLHIDLAGLVAAWNKEDAVKWNPESAPKILVSIRSILKVYFGYELK